MPPRNAVIVEGKRAGLHEGALDVGLVSRIDDWVGRLSDFLARQAGPAPRVTVLLEADPDVPCQPAATLSAHHLDVVWMSADRPDAQLRYPFADSICTHRGLVVG